MGVGTVDAAGNGAAAASAFTSVRGGSSAPGADAAGTPTEGASAFVVRLSNQPPPTASTSAAAPATHAARPRCGFELEASFESIFVFPFVLVEAHGQRVRLECAASGGRGSLRRAVGVEGVGG